MRARGGLIGVLLATLVAVSLFVGLQYAIWGSSAPDWYAIPDVLGSAVLGSAGWFIGASWRTGR